MQQIINKGINDIDTHGQIAMFHIGAEQFGISINIVKEIVRHPEITFVPKAPAYLRGIANLRGKILPVIDSRSRLGLPSGEVDDNTRVLVIETRNTSMGVVVDKVAGVVSIEDMIVENPPPILSSGIDTRYINSVIKSNNNDSIIMELDVDSLCALELKDANSIEEDEITVEEINNHRINIEENQLVTFLVSHEEYAFPIEKVREVLRVGNITEVPNVRNYVVGILTVRNSILPVIDVRRLFGMRSLVEELVSDIDLIVKTSKSWLESFRQSLEMGSNFYGQTAAEQSMLGCWIENFRTASEGIGKVAQELRYANLSLYETARSILQRTKEESRELIRKAFEAEMTAAFNILLIKIDEMKEAIRLGIGEDQRILVVEIDSMPVGILVDRMQQVIRIPVDRIENPPGILATDRSDALKGIVKLDEGKRIILLLNENKVVTDRHISELQEMDIDMKIDSDKESKSSLSKGEEIQLVTFKLGKEEFALGIEEVQEINRIEKITSVPQAPSFVEGVMNLRGNVIPAIDLRKRFEMDVRQHDESTRVIIVNMNGKLTGLIVDSVSEVLRLQKGSIENAPNIIKSRLETEYIKGVGKIKDSNRMIILIAVDKILSMDELNQLSKSSSKQDHQPAAEENFEALLEPREKKAPEKAPEVKKKEETKTLKKSR